LEFETVLDLYQKVQELATHPVLKPNKRGHIEALLKDIKADYKNSDDEDNFGRTEGTELNRSPAVTVCKASPQTPALANPLSAPGIGASATAATGTNAHLSCQTPPPPLHKDSFFMLPNPIGAPRTTCPTLSQFSSANAFTPLQKAVEPVSNLGPETIKDNSISTLNTMGQHIFLTGTGNQFLESIEQNFAQSKVVSPPAKSNAAPLTKPTTTAPAPS
jgi:hypothetical protein